MTRREFDSAIAKVQQALPGFQPTEPQRQALFEAFESETAEPSVVRQLLAPRNLVGTVLGYALGVHLPEDAKLQLIASLAGSAAARVLVEIWSAQSTETDPMAAAVYADFVSAMRQQSASQRLEQLRDLT